MNNNTTIKSLQAVCLTLLIAFSSHATLSYANAPGPDDKKEIVCPENPDVTVSTDVDLQNAINAANPGDVIAIDGLITVISNSIEVNNPGITITCKTPQSGFTFVNTQVNVNVSDVTIEKLIWRGSPLNQPINIINADNFIFRYNDVICGPTTTASCTRTTASQNTLYESNKFLATTAVVGGMQFQSGISGARIIGNEIIATLPAPHPGRGAIRISNDNVPLLDNIVVKNNIIHGPWPNGMTIGNYAPSISRVIVKHNQIRGVLSKGIYLSGPARKCLILKNTIQSVETGIALDDNACSNKIMGNNITGFSIERVFLDMDTGNNFYFGNPLNISDLGAFDCNGDFINDPNFINP